MERNFTDDEMKQMYADYLREKIVSELSQMSLFTMRTIEIHTFDGGCEFFYIHKPSADNFIIDGYLTLGEGLGTANFESAFVDVKTRDGEIVFERWDGTTALWLTSQNISVLKVE